MAIKVTTTSDVELEVVLLTDEGKTKVENGEPITKDDVINIEKNTFIQIRVRQNKDGAIYTASYNSGECVNCYIDSVVINDVECKSLVIVIPSGTYNDNGYLWVAVTTNEESKHFSDGTKDTESIFEKTEVQYVSQ